MLGTYLCIFFKSFLQNPVPRIHAFLLHVGNISVHFLQELLAKPSAQNSRFPSACWEHICAFSSRASCKAQCPEFTLSFCMLGTYLCIFLAIDCGNALSSVAITIKVGWLILTGKSMASFTLLSIFRYQFKAGPKPVDL